MGDVYRAWDTRLERHVAIKLLNQQSATDETARARFRREAKAIAALAHPNIVAIYDAELEHPPFFLVMELLEGQTLRRFMASGRLPWRRAAEIGAAVAEGLARAHQLGIVHRDIKPENLFLTSDGVVKILDFGLAHFASIVARTPDACLASTLSDANVMLGTIDYMAPEQAMCQEVSPATDIFSLGCVMYELVTGCRPFDRETPASTLLAILNAEPSWSGEWSLTAPPELVVWLRRCLEKDPRGRPQSAHDLALTLKDIGSGSHSLRHSARGSERSAIQALAVLPFMTSSSSPDADYLADGITESLINTLAQLKELRVIARSAVFRHKGHNVDPIQVGRELGVHAVLTGKIFQRGEILVIGAELADVRDGSQIWGQQYKRQLVDIFEIEEELSREISGRLRTKLTVRDGFQFSRRYTENPEAYQLYLRGRHAWNKRTIEAMRQAVVYFNQAIESDPSYARAFIGLADGIQMLGIYGDVESRHARTRARAAQEAALQIDDSQGEAFASVGFRLLYFDWKAGESEQALRRAIELTPGYASGHQWLGMNLALTRRLEQGLERLKAAQELDPFSASISVSAVWPLLWARRTRDAIEGFREAVELHPAYWVGHYYLALAYAIEADWPNAVLSARQASELGDTNWKLAGTGYVYAKAGLSQETNETLVKIEELSRRWPGGAAFSRAAVYAGLGYKDEALSQLELAATERHWNLTYLNVDPFWDDLRSNLRFQRLVAETVGRTA